MTAAARAGDYYPANGNVISNIVYPWPYNPVNPYWQPNIAIGTYLSLDQIRLEALEARVAKLERENKRLRRRLYARQADKQAT